ncbi:MAG: LysR family transcriptional regulator [Gammaproteobacteria bacterium]|nr:LysR family transcriptional regulator [Gammaproteobacteria bacterium]
MSRARPVVGLPTLSWLRAFEAAARTSSFAAAAAELNLTSGAISYQIRALERHLGVSLFERLPRGVRLTPMGVAYLPPVRKSFEELADSTVGLFGGDGRTQITVHAPVSLAALWLAPRLPSFIAANPSTDVRLSSVIWDNPLPDEATDLEIRYGAGHWHGYRSERLLTQRIIAVCCPATRRTAFAGGASAAGASAEALARQLIHIMGHEDHWLRVCRGLGLGDVRPTAGPTVDTTIAALELASSGAGCALAHRVYAEPYLRSGRLVEAIDREFDDDHAYYVVTPERPRRIRREVQAFRDWLVARAAAESV